MTRTFVVTCDVPVTDLDELELTPLDHTITVTGANGFRHVLELPGEADPDRLEVELHKHFLEIRAPLAVT
jgi:HSP20 family molecular chaperone IbpA